MLDLRALGSSDNANNVLAQFGTQLPCERWHCLFGSNLCLQRHNILGAARNHQAVFGGMAAQCVHKLGALAHQ